MGLRDLAAGLDDSAQERAVARDVEAELDAHLELAAEVLEAEGRTPDEARALARERFGDMERIRRDCMRIRTGGNHAMKIALLVSNVVLVAALLVSLLIARAQHVRAQEAMERALEAQAAALQAERQGRAATPPVVDHVVVEVGDVIETFDQHRNIDFSERAVVQPDGQVLLHDVGWIEVAGLTRQEVELHLTEAYADYYQDLTVNVVVHKATPRSQRPGASAGSSTVAATGSQGQVVSGSTPIEVGDTIEILDRNGRFDLGGPRRVDADGRVLLPRLGWTPVTGLERDQLAEQLTVAYQPYFGQLPVDILLHKADAPVGTAAPASAAVEAVLGGATTVIEVGDTIEVFDRDRELDFGERAKVAPDGKVLLPHVGWIQAAGRERDELAQDLMDALAELFVRPPVVDVILYTSEREVRVVPSEDSGSF
jgi:protein involved in polysaccharide export with SLBB domain